MGSQDDLQRVSGELIGRKRFGGRIREEKLLWGKTSHPFVKNTDVTGMGSGLKEKFQIYMIFKLSFTVKVVKGNWLAVSHFEGKIFLLTLLFKNSQPRKE